MDITRLLRYGNRQAMVYNYKTAPNGEYYLMNDSALSITPGKVYAIVKVKDAKVMFIKHFLNPSHLITLSKEAFSRDVDFIEVTPLSKALFDIQ
jgi:hypothetical protein